MAHSVGEDRWRTQWVKIDGKWRVVGRALTLRITGPFRTEHHLRHSTGFTSHRPPLMLLAAEEAVSMQCKYPRVGIVFRITLTERGPRLAFGDLPISKDRSA